MVWHGTMVGYVWYGMLCIVWHDMVWYDIDHAHVKRYGMVWYGMGWHGMVWYMDVGSESFSPFAAFLLRFVSICLASLMIAGFN